MTWRKTKQKTKLNRGKITHFARIENVIIHFLAAKQSLADDDFEWIFGETVTHWLNICELHGLWILTVMTFSLRSAHIWWSQFVISYGMECNVWSQKNTKLAQSILVSGWGRSWTSLQMCKLRKCYEVASVHDGKLSVICRIT